MDMILNKFITKQFKFNFEISKSGLVAIFVSARCRSWKQSGVRADEDLRVRLNGLDFGKVPLSKNNGFFNVPPAFSGSCLKGGASLDCGCGMLRAMYDIEDADATPNDFGIGVGRNYAEAKGIIGL